MYQIKNPVQETMASLDGAPKFFEDYVLIPSYGRTIEGSNRYLKTYHDLAQLSPSFNACDTWLKRFCFGAGIEIVDKSIPGLIQEESNDSVNDADFVQLFLSTGLSFTHLLSHSGTLNRQIMESGDSWLLVRLIKVDDEIRMSFDCLDYRTVYKLSDSAKPNDVPMIMHAKEFSREYFQKVTQKKEDFKIYPVSEIGKPFNWSGDLESGNEIYTVIHGYREIDKNGCYGKSPLDPVLNWMQVEWNYGNLSCKISASDTVTKNIVAVQQEPEEVGKDEDEGFSFNDRAEQVKRFTTNRGGLKEADTLAVMEFFDKPPSLLSLDLNRDPKYQFQTLAHTGDLIHSICGVNQILANRKDPPGGIGSEQVNNLLKMANISTVIPIQNYFASYWNDILEKSFLELGVASERIKGIRFGSTINQLIDQIGTIQDEAITESE